MERYYVNDLLPSMLVRRSPALPQWLRAAYAAKSVALNTIVIGQEEYGADKTATDGLLVNGTVVRAGDWIIFEGGSVRGQNA